MQRFDTSSVNRKNLQKLIHYLTVNEVEYTIDNYEETLLFDITELPASIQKWVNATFKSIKESRMTNDQRKRIKPLLKRLVMEVKSELQEEYGLDGGISNYHTKVSNLFNSVYDKVKSPNQKKAFAKLFYQYSKDLENLGDIK
jgi:hypothetical protein